MRTILVTTRAAATKPGVTDPRLTVERGLQLLAEFEDRRDGVGLEPEVAQALGEAREELEGLLDARVEESVTRRE